MSAYTIRPECPADVAAIDALVRVAFAGHPHSDGTEQDIIRALRAADALTLSLVAEADGTIVAHVAFSPVRVAGADAGWFGLGPLAVSPAWQGQGVGTALVYAGLSRLCALSALGARGCVVAGDAAYYSRFGFACNPALALAGMPPEHFLALCFKGACPSGAVAYHAAFGSPPARRGHALTGAHAGFRLNYCNG